MADRNETSGILTYILNNIESYSDFNYVVYNEGNGTEELNQFKGMIPDKLKYLRRMILLKSIG